MYDPFFCRWVSLGVSLGGLFLGRQLGASRTLRYDITKQDRRLHSAKYTGKSVCQSLCRP